MKKLLSIVLTLVLMLTYTTSAFAAGSTVEKTNTINQNGYKIETLENSKAHQKIKITNSKTHEIEYVESTLKNGKYEYLATYNGGEGKSKVENINGTIKITDENTKEVKYIEPVATSNKTAKTNTVMVPQIGGWDGIGYRWYSSYGIETNHVSVLVGCIVGIIGGVVTGLLTTILSGYISDHMSTVYFYQDHFVDSYDSSHFRDDTFFFKYSDYTGYKGTSSFVYYTN